MRAKFKNNWDFQLHQSCKEFERGKGENSMSKHTEGPWKVKYATHEAQGATQKHRILAGNDSSIQIAAIPGYDEMDDANARLIAAAPELLAALKETAKYWFLFGREVDVPVGLENQVKQAIAKAEGGVE